MRTPTLTLLAVAIALLVVVATTFTLVAAASGGRPSKQQQKEQQERSKKQREQAKLQQEQQQRAQQAQKDALLPALIPEPVTRLNSIEEFQHNVMETGIPCLVFLGNSKKTPAPLATNISRAATSIAGHGLAFYFDTEAQAGKDFIAATGLPPHQQLNQILLFNPDFIRDAASGGFSKSPLVYTGKTSVFGITRWFVAMSSRKHIDYISDVRDLAAFRKKYAQFSLPKVILVTGSNFTSPMFVSVGHQFRFLSHFGVVGDVTEAAYNLARDEVEREEKEMQKVKDLIPGAEPKDAASADDEEQQKKKKRDARKQAFKTIFDGDDSSNDKKKKKPSSNTKKTGFSMAKNATRATADLLKLLGVRDVPCVITASHDLSDVDVIAGRNMTLERLQQIVGDHALSPDQQRTLLPQVLEAEYKLDEDNKKAASEQRRMKRQGLMTEDDDDLDVEAKRKKADAIDNFLPVWVNNTDDWNAACPSTGGGSANLCVLAFYSDDIQQGILKYAEKTIELATGIKKIQNRNRAGITRVRLVLLEIPKHLEFARFLGAGDSVFPAVVFVNPVKGTYHHHIGKFTGDSIAEFALGRMRSLRAKVYSKDKIEEEFFVDEKALARKRRETRRREREERRRADEEREARQRKEVDEEIVADDDNEDNL